MFKLKTVLADAMGEAELSAELKSLRTQAIDNGMSEKQARRFAAGVALDELRGRDRKINLYPLFESWATHGNKRWLSPLPEIFHLYEKLLKFQGPIHILRPFIDLLIEVSEQDIDPSSFMKFVVLKRLNDDFNWRHWERNHIESLKSIVKLLVQMRSQAPFDREKLGDSQLALARDVVLVKYVGQPLSLFPHQILSDELLMGAYRQAWSRLSLNHFFSIYFLKINLLPLTYHFSGKFELSHLIALVEQIPEIEHAFETYFPPDVFSFSAKTLDINLYDKDFQKSLRQRKNKGFRNLHFFTELNSYLKIISALLRTRSGIYLSGFYARSLNKFKDPVIAKSLAELIEVLNDHGGKHIYLWHSRKLMSMEKAAHPDYIELIRQNGGADPQYPVVAEIFVDPEVRIERESIVNIANQLGLQIDAPVTSASNLLRAYIQKNPQTEPTIMRWRDEVVSGRDRDWDKERLLEYDELQGGSALHKLLLNWIMKGLEDSYKSNSFQKLFDDYKSVPKQPFPKLIHRFAQPVYESRTLDSFQEQEIRKQLDLDPVQKLWKHIVQNQNLNLNQISGEINRLSINLNKPISEAKNKILEIEQNLLGKDLPTETLAKLSKEKLKTEKSLNMLNVQKELFENAMDQFDSFKDAEKLILGLFFAGYFAYGYENSFCQLMMGLIVKNYQNQPAIKNQIDYLTEDVAFELITFEQLKKIITTLDTLRHAFGQDDLFMKLPESLTLLLRPFIKTKTKELTFENRDTAFQKLFQINKLLAIRSKWQSIIEKSSEKLAQQNEYQIFVSKAVLDAYYGDMGAVCLSGYPHAIKFPNFFNVRLVDLAQKTIVGNAVMVIAKNRHRSSNIVKFLQVFGINPLDSFLKNKSQAQQLQLYLEFKKLFEQLAHHLKIPIVLSGGNKWGILSNRHDFLELIIKYEIANGSVFVNNVLGTSIYYDDTQFSNGILIKTKSKE